MKVLVVASDIKYAQFNEKECIPISVQPSFHKCRGNCVKANSVFVNEKDAERSTKQKQQVLIVNLQKRVKGERAQRVIAGMESTVKKNSGFCKHKLYSVEKKSELTFFCTHAHRCWIRKKKTRSFPQKELEIRPRISTQERLFKELISSFFWICVLAVNFLCDTCVCFVCVFLCVALLTLVKCFLCCLCHPSLGSFPATDWRGVLYSVISE